MSYESTWKFYTKMILTLYIFIVNAMVGNRIFLWPKPFTYENNAASDPVGSIFCRVCSAIENSTTRISPKLKKKKNSNHTSSSHRRRLGTYRSAPPASATWRNFLSCPDSTSILFSLPPSPIHKSMRFHLLKAETETLIYIMVSTKLNVSTKELEFRFVEG